MKLTVNGVELEIVSPPLTPLLHVLRDELDITARRRGASRAAAAPARF